MDQVKLAVCLCNQEDWQVTVDGCYSLGHDGPSWNAPFWAVIHHKDSIQIELVGCGHSHRTREAAERCGLQMLSRINRNFTVVGYSNGTARGGFQLVPKGVVVKEGDPI